MVHLSSVDLAACTALARSVGSAVCTAFSAGAQEVVAGVSALLTMAGFAWHKRIFKSNGKEVVMDAIPDAPTHQDLLTGLAAREVLEAKLAEEWTRERRPHEPTAILLVTIDEFEALQRDSGQLGADVVLLTVARALVRMLPRKADLLARYDASTFALVLPSTDLSGALRVAARLRWSIVRLGIAHPCSESGFVTACTGVAIQHGITEDGPTQLLTTANHALLKARLGGADRLEYLVLGQAEGATRSAGAEPVAAETMRLPSIRAWVPEHEYPLQTIQN